MTHAKCSSDKKLLDIQIRYWIRRDMPSVLLIGDLSFDYPLSEDEILRMARCRETVILVVESREQDEIFGFVIYTLTKDRMDLNVIAVSPKYRRMGVGRAMVEALQKKLHDRRRYMRLDVRETNLTGQQFFRECGFRAVRVASEHFQFDDGVIEDAYVMEFHRPVSCAANDHPF